MFRRSIKSRERGGRGGHQYLPPPRIPITGQTPDHLTHSVSAACGGSDTKFSQLPIEQEQNCGTMACAQGGMRNA